MIAFVRHGQTAANRAGLLQGHVDLPLTELGAEQAADLGAWIAAQPTRPVRVVSSPLQRAQQTAAAIAAVVGIEVDIDVRLIELDYGEWDQRPLAEIVPADWARWRADPAFAPPGGESLAAVTQRVIGFASDYLIDDLVIAVSHVSPIKTAACWALGVDEGASWRMHLELASVSRVGRRGETPYLASYNEVAPTRR